MTSPLATGLHKINIYYVLVVVPLLFVTIATLRLTRGLRLELLWSLVLTNSSSIRYAYLRSSLFNLPRRSQVIMQDTTNDSTRVNSITSGAQSNELQTVLITHWAKMTRDAQQALKQARESNQHLRDQNQRLFIANTDLRNEISDCHLELWRTEDYGTALSNLVLCMLAQNPDLNQRYHAAHMAIITNTPEIIDLTADEEIDEDL